VATELSGGHAENALPQTARATVNCRILPDVSPAKVEKTLESVIADASVSVTPVAKPTPSPATPLRADVMRIFEEVTESMWPGIPVVPALSTGATDSLYLRNAGIDTYGVSGLFADVDDIRDHGKDERIGVKQFYESQEFLYRLVKAIAL
jgi:acetylornithine deacetylase/succinyl-diaminopimelate desuccinylase-like protein